MDRDRGRSECFWAVRTKPPARTLSAQFGEMLGPIQVRLINQQRAMLLLGGWIEEQPGRTEYLRPEMIAARGLTGLIVLMIYRTSYLARLAEVQRNLVILDMDASDLGVDSVSFDNLGSTIKMIQRLARHGARRVAFIGGPFPPPRTEEPIWLYDPAARERLDGSRRDGRRRAGALRRTRQAHARSIRPGCVQCRR